MAAVYRGDAIVKEIVIVEDGGGGRENRSCPVLAGWAWKWFDLGLGGYEN
jgi:hypothetical protein